MANAKNEKRARKKEHRDAELLRRQAEARRRALTRTAVVVGVLVILVFAFVSRDSDDADTDDANATASPTASASEAAPGEVACGGEEPPEAKPKQYKQPKNVLEVGVDYEAVFKTSCGDIRVDLLEKETPATVNNFVFLAQEGFYDGTIWHRVEQNFVIQGGDPDGLNGQPPDGPGYTIPDEFPKKANEYVYGVLAMANNGQPNSGGSQFFIVVHEPPDPAGLQPAYSIFGSVDESSYEVVDAIAKLETNVGATDPAEAVKPITPVYIESIEIIANR
ncbi:MAG TPA: peptidylprolyl isomerase [Actinomycetota bacterium]|nr:peptidylprolyl isomerase [Actinomycetota bacterium]